jgi:hypothetical protein
MNFDFLSNITLEAPEVKEKTVKTAKAKLPSDEVDLRVYANGKIYPSNAFAEKYRLDFAPRLEMTKENGSTELIVAGNGLDIFQSSDWHSWPKEAPSLLFAVVVPKSEPKVDLWGSCKYDDKGEPKSSILTQGTNTFSKNTLVEYLATTLGVVWEATEFVDLKMADVSVPSPNNSGVFYLPKTVTSGPRKGEPDAVRRENVSIFPLVLASEILDQRKESVPEDVEVPGPEVEEDLLDVDFEDVKDDSDEEDWAANLGAGN